MATGLTQAHPFADPANNAQAVEDAPWLGFYDTGDAYGYGVFDVDPGDGPGQTSITFQWFSVSTTDPAPDVPLEKFVFARMAGRIAAGVPKIDGTASVGRTVTADPGQWSPASVSLSYQWLRSGTAIDAALADSYTITAADLGQQLQVRVTGTLRGTPRRRRHLRVWWWPAGCSAVRRDGQRPLRGGRWHLSQPDAAPPWTPAGPR